MKKLLFILCMAGCIMPRIASAYTEVPALLHLYIGNQADTNGFNLVAEMPGLLYEHIMSGRLTLWDSPKKQVRISPEALRSIENSSNTSFAHTHNIFMNELWSSTRRKTQFVIIGFSFMNENGRDKVSYGYIDAKEAFGILSSNLIPCNINGPAELSYWDALYSRKYNFNLVQFGSNSFINKPAESELVKNKAYNPKKKVIGTVPLPQTKLITYTVSKDNENPRDPGNILFKGFDDYFNENREMFFELGGSRYFDYKTYRSELAVTRIEVTEIWQKTPKGISAALQNITIYINNKPLDPLSAEALEKMHLLFSFKTPADIISERMFSYQLIKLNDTYIAKDESIKYQRALKEYSWTQVSNYLKYYDQ